MLSAAQLNVLRAVLRGLPRNPQNSAWYVTDVLHLCRPYDRLTGYFDQATGKEAFQRLLIELGLMKCSPDGFWCKLTDYGCGLYDEAEARQREWDDMPIIPLDDAEKDQIIIKAGVPFLGKTFAKQLFKRARTVIRIQDNFCEVELLEWLCSIPSSVSIHVLTSPKGVKQERDFTSFYQAFRQERPTAEIRLTDDVHDRKIIIDDKDARHIGESLKDIGRKGTTISRLKSVQEHIAMFDETWTAATPL